MRFVEEESVKPVRERKEDYKGIRGGGEEERSKRRGEENNKKGRGEGRKEGKRITRSLLPRMQSRLVSQDPILR